MTSAFSRFPDRLQSAITSRLGWTSLRPVQELAGHAIHDRPRTDGWRQDRGEYVSIVGAVIEKEAKGVS